MRWVVAVAAFVGAVVVAFGTMVTLLCLTAIFAMGLQSAEAEALGFAASVLIPFPVAVATFRATLRCYPAKSPHTAHPHSVWMLLLGSIPLSMVITFPVAVVYGFFFSLPHPLRQRKGDLESSLAFALIEVLLSCRPLFVVYGIGLVAALVTCCTRVSAQGSRVLVMVTLISLSQFLALAIWRLS